MRIGRIRRRGDAGPRARIQNAGELVGGSIEFLKRRAGVLRGAQIDISLGDVGHQRHLGAARIGPGAQRVGARAGDRRGEAAKQGDLPRDLRAVAADHLFVMGGRIDIAGIVARGDGRKAGQGLADIGLVLRPRLADPKHRQLNTGAVVQAFGDQLVENWVVELGPPIGERRFRCHRRIDPGLRHRRRGGVFTRKQDAPAQRRHRR